MRGATPSATTRSRPAAYSWPKESSAARNRLHNLLPAPTNDRLSHETDRLTGSGHSGPSRRGHGSPRAVSSRGEQAVHLADGLRQPLHRAHVHDSLHVLAGLERHAYLHARAALVLEEPNRDLAARRVLGRRPVGVGEGVGDLQRRRRIYRCDPPHAPVLVALRTGHEIGHLTARSERVLLDRRRIARRAPPALEHARIRPEFPHLTDRIFEVGDQRGGEAVVIRLDAGDGHLVPPVASRFDIRSTRPRQVASSSSRAWRARSTAAASVWTSCSRPRRTFTTRPARSSTATCFCTAAKLIG